MKNMLLSPILLTLAGLTFGLLGSSRAAGPLPPLPPAKDLPGTLQFHGHYQHRSRGTDISQPAELWVNKKSDGTTVALAHLPFTGCTELITGDKDNRIAQFQLRRAPAGDKPGYSMDLKFNGGKAALSRWGVREDCDNKGLAMPGGACFDPNSRPDSYCAANILLRQFASNKMNEAKEVRVCDWDNTGEAFSDYTIKVAVVGKEKVQVPAGAFEANHLVLTQTSTGDTWFKKRAGQTTDFWVLENGVILRILRHREPYELVLVDYDVPGKLPGLQ